MCECKNKSCDKIPESNYKNMFRLTTMICLDYLSNISILLDKIEDDKELIHTARFMTDQTVRVLATFKQLDQEKG